VEETLCASAPLVVEERRSAVRKIFADHGVELIHPYGLDDPILGKTGPPNFTRCATISKAKDAPSNGAAHYTAK